MYFLLKRELIYENWTILWYSKNHKLDNYFELMSPIGMVIWLNKTNNKIWHIFQLNNKISKFLFFLLLIRHTKIFE